MLAFSQSIRLPVHAESDTEADGTASPDSGQYAHQLQPAQQAQQAQQEGADDEEEESVEWVMNPRFPDLPGWVPLTYVLAMHACLSATPGERPTFSQVCLQLLPDAVVLRLCVWYVLLMVPYSLECLCWQQRRRLHAVDGVVFAQAWPCLLQYV